MAKASIELIEILRNTVENMERATTYQWGHMGSCNCGFLAQEVTRLRKEEIHTRAMQGHGDWTEQLNDYCPTSSLPMDNLITELLAAGFDTDDLKNLERLSDRKILDALSAEGRNLKYNIKPDVICYMKAWIALLETQLLEEIKLPDFRVRKIIL